MLEFKDIQSENIEVQSWLCEVCQLGLEDRTIPFLAMCCCVGTLRGSFRVALDLLGEVLLILT